MDSYFKSKRKIIIGLVIALLLLYFFLHIFGAKSAPPIPDPTVVVAKPIEREVVDYINQTGTTVAYNSVNLVARVKGYLEKISFVDGTYIKKGTPLFVIEPEPYLEKLKAAQAEVATAKASSVYNNSEYARQKRMYKDNATSLNSVEKWLAKTKEVAAQIDKSTADEEIASINYSYTHISAPFDGRIGRHLVDIGNLVGNGEATNLATIEQIQPLYVYFNLNEIDLIRLRKLAMEEGFKPGDIKQITALVSMQNSDKSYTAQLDFVNTGLNASTGTMEIRAILPNKELTFVPGLFVQVKVPITKPAKKFLVPETAVLYDQVGPYLLIVDSKSIVQLNHVTLGSVSQGQRAILKGLTAEDQVIVDGLQFATPGSKVSIQIKAPDSAKKSKS